MKPPKNPTATNNLTESARPANMPMTKPISKLPKTLAASVPNGKLPSLPANAVVTKKRDTAPKPPPMNTSNNFVMLIPILAISF